MSFFQFPIAVQLLFLAPVAAILFGFFVMRPLKPELTHWPILLSCLVVTGAALTLAHGIWASVPGSSFDKDFFVWAAVSGWVVKFGLRVDGPGIAVLSMVSVVGSLIHFYAAAYMKGEEGFSRFFLVFHLFFLAMIGLLMANNFVQMYLFWELVGVSSYLLIGYWFHKASARGAALKAIMTNRLGDFGFLLALVLMIAVFKVTRFQLLYIAAAQGLHAGYLPVIGLLLIWAACAKSAQFPLYFWLPDAMEGPTPTSALMHAATMVTAGVFMLVRAWPLIAQVSWLPPLIASIGAFTAVFAAVVAATKKDLKRILAYSTVSHLGVMMLALGLGQVALAIFHLIVHGFFKAALFLCAGNIGHAIHQPTANVDDVGGWRRALPWTYACFVISALSLAGIWGFAGFYSKDAIMEVAWGHGGLFAAASVLISFGSAFYIGRMLFLTFHGERPEQKGLKAHPHEGGIGLVLPIALLAVGAWFVGLLAPQLQFFISAGWLGLPTGIQNVALNLPGSSLIPALSWRDMLGRGCLLAGLGFAVAYGLTMLDASWDWRWRRASPAAEAVFDSDFGWKILVGWTADAVVAFARFCGRILDKSWWDGVIEGSAYFARGLSETLAGYSVGRLNDYLWWMLAGAALLLGKAMR
ncbi:MAG TPA: NADH-quinone oxidoreductase subunit L [Elusimicrobiota bacterium]|nr:NADH-quinone oxidoreductase subunit L [Elusimicrobiota bacterium]